MAYGRRGPRSTHFPCKKCGHNITEQVAIDGALADRCNRCGDLRYQRPLDSCRGWKPRFLAFADPGPGQKPAKGSFLAYGTMAELESRLLEASAGKALLLINRDHVKHERPEFGWSFLSDCPSLERAKELLDPVLGDPGRLRHTELHQLDERPYAIPESRRGDGWYEWQDENFVYGPPFGTFATALSYRIVPWTAPVSADISLSPTALGEPDKIKLPREYVLRLSLFTREDSRESDTEHATRIVMDRVMPALNARELSVGARSCELGVEPKPHQYIRT